MAGDQIYPSPKQILDARHLRPRKRFGQNFLTDPRVADRIAAALPEGAFVVEIGGGTGTLSQALAHVARRLIILEVDRDLSLVLRERFEGVACVDIVTEDVLRFDLTAALGAQPPPRAVCGNLPYYITTPILERLFSATAVWECAVLMVQREYALRLIARPGTQAYGSLSVYAAYFAEVEKLFDIGAAGFYPTPEVASTVLRLRPRSSGRPAVRDEEALLWLVRAAFRHRRKTLVNSLTEHLPNQNPRLRAGIEESITGLGQPRQVRGERLSLADFCALADTLTEQGLMEKLWISRPLPIR
jgi:16S rRNA (adenine1518-N6/adenine1519-N6)-dimethyltransferase